MHLSGSVETLNLSLFSMRMYVSERTGGSMYISLASLFILPIENRRRPVYTCDLSDALSV